MGNQQSNTCLEKEIKHLKKQNKKQKKEIEKLEKKYIDINNRTEYNDKIFFQNTKYQNLNLTSLTTIANTNGYTPEMKKGRTITHVNETSITLDLYVTIGGSNPQGITKIATLQPNGVQGSSFVFNILDYDISGNPIGYNTSYNFNVLKSGDPIPQYNAGPTLVEFGTNQIWSGSTPELRDTFDISCVPAGIGNLLCDDGQNCRNKAIKLSLNSGFTKQQAYNYNVGAQIIPPSGTSIPSGNLSTVSVTNPSAPYSSQAITYPLDTAVPKQQTGSAEIEVAGNYIVNWINPIVSLGNYKI